MLIFTCRPFSQKSAPRLLKIAKMAPRLASRWPSRAQLGSNLAPSWPRFWTIRPKSAKTASKRIFMPRSLPRPPRAPPDLHWNALRAGAVDPRNAQSFPVQLNFVFQLTSCFYWRRARGARAQGPFGPLGEKGPFGPFGTRGPFGPMFRPKGSSVGLKGAIKARRIRILA